MDERSPLSADLTRPLAMLPRVLEPEAMDSPEEAVDYDAMDHHDVNECFVTDFLRAFGGHVQGLILDVGTGTARIPIALCRRNSDVRILGIDLAEAMLEVGRRNVAEARLEDRILLEKQDARTITAVEGPFAAVVSNSIIHHIPEPGPIFAQMVRGLGPNGRLFVRDLARPSTREQLEALVDAHAGNEPPAARRLFADSLHAALTLEEVREILRGCGIPDQCAVLTSDRHWTVSWDPSC